MLLDYLTAHETVQGSFIVVLGACFVVGMFLRYLRLEGERKSQDQRQKDAVATQISLGRNIAPIPTKTVLDNGGE